jgi:hypothetical protein
MHMSRKHARRSIGLGLGAAIAITVLAAGSVAAASPVGHARAGAQRQVETIYYPDDICGPRSGWTTVTTTFRWSYIELSDGRFNFSYTETGTYHTDFDDPSIPSYDSQFTGAQHGTVTRGGTQIFTSTWHDFPGSITIREQILFVQVGDEVKIDRDDLLVEGCP